MAKEKHTIEGVDDVGRKGMRARDREEWGIVMSSPTVTNDRTEFANCDRSQCLTKGRFTPASFLFFLLRSRLSSPSRTSKSILVMVKRFSANEYILLSSDKMTTKNSVSHQYRLFIYGQITTATQRACVADELANKFLNYLTPT